MTKEMLLGQSRIFRGLLKAWDESNYEADVLLIESERGYMRGVPVNRAIPSASMVTGRYVTLVMYDEADPKDAVVVAVHTLTGSSEPQAGFVWKDASESALSLTNQTSDINWTDLDLTAYTSSTARVAYLRLKVNVDSITSGDSAILQVRKNGTTPVRMPRCMAKYDNGDRAGADIYAFVLVGMDSGQVIEYELNLSGSIQVDITINVLGYFE